MTRSRVILACVIAVLLTPALERLAMAQPQQNRAPSIGYVYPAGGQRGTVVEAIVGGQSLRGVQSAYVSGEHVRATVLKHYPPVRNLQPEQRAELQRRMRECAAKEWAKLQARGLVGPPPPEMRPPASQPATQPSPEAKLPDHWLWDDLESKNLYELNHVRHLLQVNASRRQPNDQMAETVLLRIEIDSNAEPGDRELRLVGRGGITNTLVFQVGTLPETRELEHNDPDARATPLPPLPALSLPVLINGQVLAGDVDRHRFVARRGQTLVLRASARRLVPFIADAVPGWFEAAIAVLDEKGRELAFADHHLFDPDPVLQFRVPSDGPYLLEVRDAIYRGREDFVYRVSIEEVSRGAGGEWPARDPIGNRPVSTRMPAGLQLVREQRENDSLNTAQPVAVGSIIEGAIDSPGDRDVFRFSGKAGQDVVIEVTARRDGSPMDSLVRLFDGAGKVVAWNDDAMIRRTHLHPDWGTQTHHADSYLQARLPADGVYFVQVSDAQGQHGANCTYRLRVSPPRPDFEVRLASAAVTLEPGRWSVVTAHVLRRDGFAGEIVLRVKDAPPGVVLAGGHVPPGVDSVKLTLGCDRRFDGVVPIALEASATIAGETIRREVVPADDVEQAFLWHHLVPREQMLVACPVGGAGNRVVPLTRLKGDARLQLHAGDTTTITLVDDRFARAKGLELRIKDGPAGVTIGLPRVHGNEATFDVVVSADAKLPAGGSLLLEASSEMNLQRAGGQNETRRLPMGLVPAVVFEATRGAGER